MFQIQNPIPRIVEDPKDLRETIAGLKLVPYLGTTSASSHSYLKLFYDLYALSPSFSSVVEDKSTFAFGGEIDIVDRIMPGVLKDRIPISEADRDVFITAIDDIGISPVDILEGTCDLFRNEEISGNCYLKVSGVFLGDRWKFSADVLDPLQVLYLADDSTSRTVVHAFGELTRKGLTDSGYELLRVFPYVKQSKSLIETVFHWKTQKKKWYGLPRGLSTLYWQFIEYSIANLNLKISQSEFTTAMILAFEGADPKTRGPKKPDDEEGPYSRLQKTAQVLKKIMTNEGNPNSPNYDPSRTTGEASSMAVVEYPQGGKPPEAIPIRINRDYGYYMAMLNKASDYIYSMNSWSKELSGMVQTGAGIGSNILMDLFQIKDEAVIRPLQDRFSFRWQQVFDWIAEVTQNEQLKQRSIVYSSKLDKLIKKFNASKNNQQAPRGDNL